MLSRFFLGLVAASLLGVFGAAAADMTVSFADPAWNGKSVPKGQQCRKFGGKGATPALIVEGIPEGANAVIVEFNDRDYQPLSYNGGHGKIGFNIKGGGRAELPAVPGNSKNLPEGAFVAARNRATGAFAVPGYLPPCSGGRRHAYFADVKAVHRAADGKTEVLAKTRIELGRY